MDAYTLILILQFSQLQAPVVTTRKPYVSQAEYYARVCSEEGKWTEPTPIPGNTIKDRIKDQYAR